MTDAVRLDRVEDAVAALRRGESIVVVDDEDRENEGDLIFAAATATTEQTAFMIRHTSGFICVGMEGEVLDRLHLPPMTAVNQDRKGTAYAVTVDAVAVQSTGISAADRATTIRVLASDATTAADLTRPGHVMPLRAVPGGVLRRPGHTEAAVDLARMAGLPPAGALCELVNDDGTMMDAVDCRAFCDEHGIPLVAISDLVRHRLRSERLVQLTSTSPLPTAVGTFTAHRFTSVVDGTEHIALVMGDVGDHDGRDVLVRVHAECVDGDVFGSTVCDCGVHLERALAAITAAGRGVVVYVRPQADQVDWAHGEPVAGREEELDYGTGAQILAELGVRSMVLLTRNPDRRYRLAPFGLSITGVRPLD